MPLLHVLVERPVYHAFLIFIPHLELQEMVIVFIMLVQLHYVAVRH